jgi:hypothetical protein
VEAFGQYVTATDANAAVARDLIGLLREARFGLEAEGLACVDRGEPSFIVDHGPWQGETAFVGPTLPHAPRVGDLWVDSLTVTPMVYIESAEAPGPDLGRWVSVRPILAWQFEAFRGVAKIGPKRTEFPSPEDYLARPTLAVDGFAADIYQDEALAFGHWFGEALASQTDWQDAREVLPAAKLASMPPPGRLAWDESEYPLSEFARMAFSAATLDKDPIDEDDQRVDGTNIGAPDRVVFEEWDRSEVIGFSVRIRANRPRRVPAVPATLMFDFENSASTRLAALTK